VRIASLLPSATEIVFALGLGDCLVGVTHECDYPPEARGVPVLTRNLLPAGLTSVEIDAAVSASLRDAHTLYDLDVPLLASLAPDLVLTQNLCEVCAVPRALVDEAVCSMPQRARVLSLDPSSLEGMLSDIGEVGAKTGREAEAAEVVSDLKKRIDAVRLRASSATSQPRVFCAEWLDPIFCAGHWLPEMVRIAGGEERLGRPGTDSVRISWDSVLDYAPEVVVLMPCGFDATGALAEACCLTERPGWPELSAVGAGKVFIVDANSYFARPGPRLVDGLEILARLINPDLFPAPLPPGYAFKLAPGTDRDFVPFR
jgi:iron complex transport system substrate-binding protein